ncbi:MAG: 30S ribosomal protein S8 [Candidatus Woesearchaeota archaeon]
MSNNDPLAACLSKIDNAEKVSKKTIVIANLSKTAKKILEILQNNKYLGEFVYQETRRGNNITINLINKVNHCGAIKPRYKVQSEDLEKFEQRYLPAKGFGLLIISTSQGLMTNTEAKEKGIGGRLIAYCY